MTNAKEDAREVRRDNTVVGASENLTAVVRFLRDQILVIMTLNQCTLEFALDMMRRKLPMDLDQAYEAARSLNARVLPEYQAH